MIDKETQSRIDENESLLRGYRFQMGMMVLSQIEKNTRPKSKKKKSKKSNP